MDYTLITTKSGIAEALLYLQNAVAVGVDIETTSLFARDGEISLIQLSDGKKVFIIDCIELDGRYSRNYISSLNEENAKTFWKSHYRQSDSLQLLVAFLERGRPRKVIQNLKFEASWFQEKLGCEINGAFDTYLTGKLLEMPSDCKLDTLLHKYLGVEVSKEEQKSNWSGKLSKEQMEYAARDAFYLPELREKLIYFLKQADMIEVASIEFNAVRTVAKMESAGFPIDESMYSELVDELIIRRNVRAKELEEVLNDAMGYVVSTHVQGGLFGEDSIITVGGVNLNSPVQVKEAFLKLGVPLEKTDKHTVNLMVSKYPQLRYLTDYRAEQILVTAFGKKILALINKQTGRIHPNFWQMGAATGRFSSSNPNCFPPDVEILTETGWVRFDELSNHLVAEYNTTNGGISFVKPLSIIKQKIQGQLIRNYTAQHIDLTTTLDHDYLIRNRKTGTFSKITAVEIPEDYELLNAGVYTGSGVELTTSEVGLLCAVQADASVRDGNLDFVFIKERKIERLRSILGELKIPYLEVKKGKATRFKIKRDHTPSYIQKIFDKRLLTYSAETIRKISEEVFFWDGLSTRKTFYTSKYKQNCDWVQICLLLSGRRARVKARTVNGVVYWDVYASHRNHSMTTNLQKEFIPYDGLVYCVEVPSGNIIVRQHGRAYIIGNCQQMPHTENFRRCFRPADPARCFVIADYSGIELRILAQISQDPVMIDAFNNNKDLHSITAIAAFNLDCSEKEVKTLYPEHRAKAKGLNFGVVYGIGAGKYAENTGITLSEGKKAIRGFYDTYKGVEKYLYAIEDYGIKNRHVRTLAGRKLQLYFDSSNEKEIGMAKRNARNYPIQGSSADILKLALGLLYPRLVPFNNAWVVNIVHDEIIIECDRTDATSVQSILSESMLEAAYRYLPDIYVEAVANISEDWSEK